MKRLIAALAALVLATACDDAPQPTGSEAPMVLNIGFSGNETSPARLKLLDDYRLYLERELGVTVKTFNASDYTGIAQAMAAGQVDIAQVGASNYANLRAMMGDGVMPILTMQEVDGSLGYYSVMFARSDSAIRTLDDVRGKSIAWADVGSSSGYLVPRHFLRKQGLDPDTFFSTQSFAGGHEQGVIAVLQGVADVGVTWVSGIGDESKGYTRGILYRMVEAGMLDMSNLRVIWKAGPIPNGPIVIRTAIPADMRERIIEAHIKLRDTNREVFEVVTGGESAGFVRVPAGFYDEIIAMREAEVAARRGN